MSKNLVIVESPAKGKTIEKFLGPEYKVRASYGHIRDLPKGEMGVDTKNNFKPKYIIPKKSQKIVNELKKEMEQTKTVYLATDPDREGEAIAWHTTQACFSDKKCSAKKLDFRRVVFYEITKKAVTDAIKNPQKIDFNLVDAQQARRILDRLVGYNLSPLLWKKVRKGLSAGRVQSVALRLIVDREREIENFKPEEYWEVFTSLQKQETGNKKQDIFDAKLIKKDDKKIEIKNEKEAKEIVSNLEKAIYKVKDIIKKEVKRFPAPPFTTSTLQQESARKLRFSAKKTMVVAQQLYEGINIGGETVGLITYMRTDSFNLSEIALKEAKEVIETKFGKKYTLDTPRRFKARKSAQEAHEAIRPTYSKKYPEDIKNYLTPDQFKLYNLIWKRTIACQMKEAIFDQVIIDIEANTFILRASGSTIKFPGFINVYLEGTAEKQEKEKAEKTLPELKINEILKLIKITPNQKFTEPPKRYTEASLIKTLEENGIGRPSTYAPTISTIQERGYVTLVERRFYPQAIGFIVNDLLNKHFPFVVNIEFTAEMEEELDKIAEGELKWVPVISDFYKPFEKQLKEKEEKIKKVKFPEKKTDEKCDICGSKMVIKHGRFGEFLACSKWPECKESKPIVKKVGIKCPNCKKGDIIERKTKKGRTFYGCSNYPDCNFATWNKPIDTPCPKCGKLMTEGRDKTVSCFKCGYKEVKK